LAASGIGKIGLVDYDNVDISNLHRQISHNFQHIGWKKVDSARKTILDINPHIQCEVFPIILNQENALGLIEK
jgi:molybdopterin/thiamine biosynthesis adenylyltransferase